MKQVQGLTLDCSVYLPIGGPNSKGRPSKRKRIVGYSENGFTGGKKKKKIVETKEPICSSCDKPDHDISHCPWVEHSNNSRYSDAAKAKIKISREIRKGEVKKQKADSVDELNEVFVLLKRAKLEIYWGKVKDKGYIELKYIRLLLKENNWRQLLNEEVRHSSRSYIFFL
jgi:hypothetical protein